MRQAIFSPYADVDRGHVCPQRIAEDVAQLALALDECEKFADQRLAYLEKHESRDSEIAPTARALAVKNCTDVQGIQGLL